MKINENILPLIKKFIEKNIDLIENAYFQRYVEKAYEYESSNEDYAGEIVSTLVEVLKECHDPRYILGKIDTVPESFFSEETNIIIPKNILKLESHAIDVGNASLIKFEKSGKPIQMEDDAILVFDEIGCIEFNRPARISVDIIDGNYPTSIKKFNIFSDIAFYWNRLTEPTGTFLDYVDEDGEINIKNGVNVTIRQFSSNSGKEIKEYLSSLGLENVNIV